MRKRIHILYRLVCLVALCVVSNGFAQGTSDSDRYFTDGPYVLYTGDHQVRMVTSDKKGGITDTLVKRDASLLFPVYAVKGGYRFTVQLHPFRVEDGVQPAPEKLFALSDPHGDMVSFISVLQANRVIDTALNWSYGKNQLVVIGDVFDRGEDVLPIFWLIYKLEDEALKAGGRVHFLIGNHEEMALRGNMKYAADKYKRLAEAVGIPYASFWSDRSELGRWLRTKNTMLVIGKTLFVHGGLSKAMLDAKRDIDDINRIVASYIGEDKAMRDKDVEAAFVFGSDGPLWYRGMAKDDEKYHPLSRKSVDELLARYDVSRIVLGHTILKNVTSRYGGKVVTVNVKNRDNREAGESRGIEIVGDTVFVVYDSGRRIPLAK